MQEEEEELEMIILEGPDGCGKTTLANYVLQRRPTYKVVHHGRYRELSAGELFDAYAAPMAEYRTMRIPHALVYDRSWISEVVYGARVRNEVRLSDDQVGELNWLSRTLVTSWVFCLPPYRVARENWLRTLTEQYVVDEQTYADLHRVFAETAEILRQDCHHVVVYDYTRDDPEELMREARI